MGDNGEIKKEEPQIPQEPKAIQLLISLYPDGRLDVTGAIQQKGLCYMMLELAKDVVRDFKTNLIVPPKHGIMDFVRRR